MPFVSNHVGSSPTGSSDSNCNVRITVVISSCRFMWSISGETVLILVGYISRFQFAEVLKSTISASIFSKLSKIFSKHERVTMDDNLYLKKWNYFLKSMILPIIKLVKTILTLSII